ncbi:hypothetical protein EUTSA_v10012224mg [Eutrema salsugineum]|uniref:DUF4283 domain-containing protein n=1 Tax=Eutrema salsugineum TaxID=72664 RepID=V4KUL9_EUTSA|nr:hypothetical protein EUTSA_v10012224mg [Eutrema salsugineum]
MSRKSDLISAKGKSSLQLDPIVIPAFDNSDLLASYKLTLVGRVLNSEMQAHRVRALIALMPQAWNLEGRVQGVDLERGRFHFRFQSEEELQSVLEKRPFFFDQWIADFPSTMLFWIRIDGIPPHYQKEETVKGIGEKLGDLIEWETTSARVRVSVECEIPLKFERRVIFYTGDEVIVTFRYKKLQKFCFICQRLSHDGRHSPDLEEEKRKQKPSVRREIFAEKEDNHVEMKKRRKVNKVGNLPKAGLKDTLEENQQNLVNLRTTNSLMMISQKQWVHHPKVQIVKRPSYMEKTSPSNLLHGIVIQILEKVKSDSDPGKVCYQRSPSPSAIKRSQRKEDKGRALQPPVSTGSRVMDSNSCDLEEVISPMKEMMASKIPIMSESLDELGGRRGRSIKSRLGSRSNVTLQVKKKITRSSTMGLLSKKRSAPSLGEPSKKRVNADLIISQCIQNPSSSKPESSQGKNLEEPKELVVKEKPPAKP